jgi:hypothetical protein
VVILPCRWFLDAVAEASPCGGEFLEDALGFVRIVVELWLRSAFRALRSPGASGR